MTVRYLTLLILCLLAGIPGLCREAAAPSPKSSYVYLHLDQEAGLASNHVLSILQDSRGFMWFGTNNGLQRYDGRQFIHYRHNPLQQNSLASDMVEMLFEDSQKQLWIASASTITRFDPLTQTFRPITLPDLRQENGLRGYQFVEDAQQQVWLLPPAGGQPLVCRAGKTAFASAQDAPAFKHPHTLYAAALDGWKSRERYAFLQDSRGRVWAGSEALLLREPGAREFRPIPQQKASRYGIEYNRIFALEEDRQGTVWIGTDKGVYYFNPAKERFFMPQLPRQLVAEGLSLVPTDFLQTFNREIWVSTLSHGLLVYDSSFNFLRQHSYATEAARQALPVWCLVQDKEGRVWAGSQEGTLMKLDRQGKIVLVQPAALRGATIREAALEAGGTLWLGTERGQLFTFDPNTERCTAVQLIEAGSGAVGRILRILTEHPQYLWVATSRGGVFQLKKESARVVDRLYTGSQPWALLSNEVGDMQWADSSSLLISTVAGLHRYDSEQRKGKVFTTADGLPANALINVVVGKGGDLFIAPQNSLSRWNLTTHRSTTYGPRDGLLNAPYIFNNSYRLQDGRILLGTMDHFFYFHPDSLRQPEAPTEVLITGLKIFDKPIGLDSLKTAAGNLHLRHNQNFFTLEYACLSYYNANRISYYYQLEGVDQGWVKAGSNRFANYTNIAGGKYRFKVKAALDDGITPVREASLDIEVGEPVWQSWWFRSLLLLVLAGVVAALYKMRMERLLALENMRVQISRDLHDDMGSTLSTINILSALAREQMQNDAGQTQQQLEKISDYSQRMMETMDDIVWSINPLNDAGQNLVARMRNYCAEALEPKGIAFHIEVDETVPRLHLPLAQKHNCFMIFKEALNNAAKYAQCQSVRICLQVKKKQLVLVLEDDGRGFDTSQAGEGNGLLNMQARAGVMQGSLTIDSIAGRGTIIILKFPI